MAYIPCSEENKNLLAVEEAWQKYISFSGGFSWPALSYRELVHSLPQGMSGVNRLLCGDK